MFSQQPQERTVELGSSSISSPWSDFLTKAAREPGGSTVPATPVQSAETGMARPPPPVQVRSSHYGSGYSISSLLLSGGFGVCCIFGLSCGGTSAENSTYLTTEITSEQESDG